MYDIVEFLRLIKRAEKQKQYESADKTIRVAILGAYSTQYLAKGIRYLLYQQLHVQAILYEGAYDGIAKTLLDPHADYFSFHADVTILLPDNETTDIAFYTSIWKRLPGYVLQSNFVTPNVSALGNLEVNVAASPYVRLQEANLQLTRQKPSNVTILDLDGLSARVGKDRWFDYPAYFSTKQGFRLDYLEAVCGLIVRQIGALLGRTRKCLVLDLDNTLWGGVVGDDGWQGIVLDPNDPVGEAYRFFQKYVLRLKERGVILAVCSKNEPQIAEEAFEKNENMVLHRSDIACFVANWEDKANNLREIAGTLNIGLDSLVFFDDNPVERERIRTSLPEVMVVDVPDDPAYYAKALSDTGAFDWLQLTREDLSRAASYQSNQERQKLMRQAEDYDAFLDALEMRYTVGFLDAGRVSRFAQLINKSNQFNLRTQRYSEAQIEQMMQDPQYRLIYAELTDKFDHYGLISCVILKGNFIDTWVMSCRVLKRRVEEQVFRFILENTTGSLYGEYIPTAKNAMVRDFYPQLGFQKTEVDGRYLYERV